MLPLYYLIFSVQPIGLNRGNLSLFFFTLYQCIYCILAMSAVSPQQYTQEAKAY